MSLKTIDNPKIFKKYSTIGEDTTKGFTKCKSKRCGVCEIITEGNPIHLKTRKKIQNQ